MAAKTFTITREKAVALLVQLGMSSKKAEKLDAAKLAGKLSAIDDTDEDADPGKYRKTFEKLVAANQKEYDIEIEEDEAPAKASKKKAAEPAAKKGKKGKAAKAEPAAKKKRTSSEGPSNKERVYKEWKSRKGEAKKDYESIMKKAKAVGNVKDTTVRAWLSAWARGQNLPGCAN